MAAQPEVAELNQSPDSFNALEGFAHSAPANKNIDDIETAVFRVKDLMNIFPF